MHIVYVTTELATKNNSSGGLATYIANMSKIFAKHGHKVTIILTTTKEQTLEFEPDIELINVYIEKKRWEEISQFSDLLMYDTSANSKLCGYKTIQMYMYKSKLVFQEIQKIHKVNPIDIVHVTNLGFLSCQFDDSIPYVVRMSSFLNMCEAVEKEAIDPDMGMHRMSLINQAHLDVIMKTRFTISPSYYLQRISQEEYGFSPTVLESPYIVENEIWKNDIYEEKLLGKKYVLFFGSLKFLKGVQVIAKIAERILSNNDVYLVLAGNDTLLHFESGDIIASEYIKNSAKEYANKVIYMGRPVREELYPIIDHAEICLFPSRIENLSNACIEAMAMGKIVVATNGVSYEQLIEDRISGFLCERDNEQAFIDGIEEALHLDTIQKETMQNNARKMVERLSPDQIYKKYLAYYESVISQW